MVTSRSLSGSALGRAAGQLRALNLQDPDAIISHLQGGEDA
jgi:hypothetical protein